ncbi:GGDEF domain-containing protein [Parasulfuritortus cantonensis]|uniref:diguanylate cyclase n=1 Tax=Parasulfuritortus cantonensis TaxID=2528202 RepID=A0A4R1BEP8_9PROT|nr:GGDEF domain-containing protein [Parasulfuritortus cantonensis]TCJ15557.1 GGDEF domain-containing protein [Parasulfuritortus cantonensis]
MSLADPERHLSDVYRIDRLTAEFLFPETEQAFRSSIRDAWIEETRRAIFLAALFFLMFAFTDHVIMIGDPDYFLVLASRIVVTAVALSAAYSAQRLWRHMVDGFIPSVVVVFGLAAFVWKVTVVPVDYGVHGMGMMAMLLGVYVFIPNRFLNVVVIALVASFGFMLVTLIHFNLSLGQILTVLALLVVTNILGAMAARRTSLTMRKDYCAQAVLRAANERLEREAEERRRLEAELRHRADHDDTTGVANRAAFFDAAGRLFAETEEARQPLSLIMADVDYFKQLNGTYGHLRGDDVLRALVEVCAAVLPQPYFLARFGGEEFVVLLPGTALEGAGRVAERVRAECQRMPVAIAEVAIHFSISAGVVQRRPGERLNVLLRRADEAMFAAKYRGRNRVEVAD